MEGPELKSFQHAAPIFKDLLLHLVDHDNPSLFATVPDDLQVNEVRNLLKLGKSVLNESKGVFRNRPIAFLGTGSTVSGTTIERLRFDGSQQNLRTLCTSVITAEMQERAWVAGNTYQV